MINVGSKKAHNSINEKEFLLFSSYIAEKSGIVIPPEKSYLIETRLSKLMADSGADNFKDFYDCIISSPDPFMQQKIINAITINETSWFRDSAPLKVLGEELLPGLVKALAAGKKTRVKIWCAATSTGQEVYSTVMCVDDYLKKNKVHGVSLSDFEFVATDISSKVLEIAKKGRYNNISMMRGLDDYYKAKYFVESDSAWDIDPLIRKAVRFEKFNLQDSYQKFGLFDIIFMRYVLIYFSDSTKKKTIAKMHGALKDDGVLFIGNYALYNMFEDGYDAHYYENLTYYSKKTGV